MLEIKDLVRCDVTAKCMSAVTRGGIDNVLRLEFDGRLTGDFSDKSYYCKFTAGTIDPEKGLIIHKEMVIIFISTLLL
ncbi:hypothetical protein [Klebsiella pneumoniae]|uniref:hypothetical protein n=1 Tax=Klebsiella pneumoniae TaxID=573 RepID=UPI001E2C3D2C|nr:hypothetical protein [Klebsiella pneumoniae]